MNEFFMLRVREGARFVLDLLCLVLTSSVLKSSLKARTYFRFHLQIAMIENLNLRSTKYTNGNELKRFVIKINL